MRLKFGFAAMLAVLASAQGAFAQGCALCYTTASALGQARFLGMALDLLNGRSQ